MKNNTKNIFLNTASSLFANKGYHATGISEIIKKSNAPKGSLYYHFPQGKEQLAQEALQRTALNIYNELTTAFLSASTPLQGIQQHLLLIAKKIEANMFQPNVSISLMALETFASNEKLRLECAKIFEQIQAIYHQQLLKILDDSTYANFLAMNMVMLTEGAITLSLTQKSTKPLHQLANNLPFLLKLDTISGENNAQ